MDELASSVPMSEHDRRLFEIIAEEGARLRSFIRKRVPNEADAADLLQEVFYELVAAYRLMEPVERWSAWMYRVARNRIIDLFRRKRLSGRGGESAAPAERELSTEEMPAATRSGPAATYARTVLLDEIEEALDELPPEQREVFVAHEIEGRSFKQISAATGVGVNTLLSRKHYAVVHLRRRLRAIHDEFLETIEEDR
jgi:RNA polymerase sigma factor (sigma-70 family)